MMKRMVRLGSPQAGQGGQALILALILLAIGPLVVIPALRLSDTSLKGSQIVTQRAKSFYATDAAQEFVLWKLVYTAYPTYFTYDGQTDNFAIDVCGAPVPVTVVMRARPTWRGVTLIRDTPIKPSKTVSGPVSGVYTYIIKLEQISENVSQGLDAVYDILPAYTSASSGSPYYDYVAGSSRLRVDGGFWQSIADPTVEKLGGNLQLKWPATYDYSTGTGGFTSPTSNFTDGQIKEIKFEVQPSSLGPNVTYYNWVVLKPWDTLAGPTAPVVTGTGATPKDGLLAIAKSVSPNLVFSGQTDNVTYSVNITNLKGSTNKIQQITDYLPPGFFYVGPTTGMPSNNFTQTFETVNGISRWKLDWVFQPAWSIGANPPGNLVTFTFVARFSANVSGSYYNEILVIPNAPTPTAFSTIGISDDDFSSGYSWNSAPVIVPSFDSSATSGGVTTRAKLNVSVGDAAIGSYQVR